MIVRMQPANHTGQERRDEILLGPRPLDRPRYQVLHAANLDLYIKEGGAPVSAENIFQRRRGLSVNGTRRKQVLQTVPPYNQAMKLRIMAKDGFSVARQADIELKSVGSMGQGKVESGDRIFGSAVAAPAGAAVSEQ
jgi:hypothetical protein